MQKCMELMVAQRMKFQTSLKFGIVVYRRQTEQELQVQVFCIQISNHDIDNIKVILTGLRLAAGFVLIHMIILINRLY